MSGLPQPFVDAILARPRVWRLDDGEHVLQFHASSAARGARSDPSTRSQLAVLKPDLLPRLLPA